MSTRPLTYQELNPAANVKNPLVLDHNAQEREGDADEREEAREADEKAGRLERGRIGQR